jgi:two-component system chemotaxis response regulator CheB
MSDSPLRVMVVDDSAFMRKFLGDIIKQDKDLLLVGTARDGKDALRKWLLFKPDVITLDVEMPNLDGIETLKRIMEEKPLPVLMISSHTKRGSEIALEALSAGAVDVLAKPTYPQQENMDEIRKLLPEKIKMVAGARLVKYGVRAKERTKKVMENDAKPSFGREKRLIRQAPRYAVAIGASTGGPRALEEIMRDLPQNLPAAVFITQHMPVGFTKSLAARLDRASPLEVTEVTGGETALQGCAYLAQGGYHLILENNRNIALSSSAPVQHVRPAADVMMASLSDYFGANMIGVILTGMGKDGTDGMAKIKENGGRTIVQEPSTAVIPSMPNSVIKAGLADIVVPLDRIATTISRLLT